MRKKIIAGNWKMHLVADSAQQLVSKLFNVYINTDASEVVLFPPAIYIQHLAWEMTRPGLVYGAQNCSARDQMAMTGEISADMLLSIGAKYCLVGHSERRQYFGETDADCLDKVKALIKNHIKPVLCVGEHLSERESGNHFKFVEKQLKTVFEGLTPPDMAWLVIAYEPVWAIGTGKTASTREASEMHTYIRKLVADSFNAGIAESIQILYGGSANENNAKDLLHANDIDGLLVGGASLKAEAFTRIVESV